jgi:acyl dehydratase
MNGKQGDGRWRGVFFDEWQVGEIIAHEIRRTVTETDNLLLSTITHNPQPRHIDREAASASAFGQILVNGTFTFALPIGVSVRDTPLGTLVAKLGHDKLLMPKRVFIGDTLRADGEVAALKESRSRPGAGIVTCQHRAIKQRGEIVCQGLRSALSKRRAA